MRKPRLILLGLPERILACAGFVPRFGVVGRIGFRGMASAIGSDMPRERCFCWPRWQSSKTCSRRFCKEPRGYDGCPAMSRLESLNRTESGNQSQRRSAPSIGRTAMIGRPNVHDASVCFLRVRSSAGQGDQMDCIHFSPVDNVVPDHLSLSWTEGETIGPGGTLYRQDCSAARAGSRRSKSGLGPGISCAQPAINSSLFLRQPERRAGRWCSSTRIYIVRRTLMPCTRCCSVLDHWACLG